MRHHRQLSLLLLLASLVVAASGFAPVSPCTHYHSVTSASSSSTSLQSIPNPLDTFTSGLASICRLPKGITVTSFRNDDAPSTIKLLQLYDVENSRECRTVRELLTELDVTVDCVIPAAPNSRSVADASYPYALPSGASVPCLVVDNGQETSTLSGSDTICNYLRSEFGIADSTSDDSDDLKQQAITILNQAGSYVAGIFRIGRGKQVSPAALQAAAPRPDQPLILYSYEGNQFCRLVREVLTELDLPYELRNAGKQSTRRTELSQLTGGSTQCPYLMDPNNANKQIAESADIIRYLYQQYALWTPPNELLQWASQYVLPLAKPVFNFLTPAQAGSLSADKDAYEQEIAQAMAKIEAEVKTSQIIVYTYGLSPFSSECKALLDSVNVSYTEISLGQEWIPGLIKEGGAAKRAALLRMTGQSSLPHIFVGGASIGGLYSGTPGLLPALEAGSFLHMVKEATTVASTVA